MVEALALIVWTFLLMYFHHINILGFILYSVVLCIFLKFIVKFSPLHVVFSRKGFHVNMVFFFIFIFHYCVIDHNKHDFEKFTIGIQILSYR